MGPSILIDDANTDLDFYGIQWAVVARSDSLHNRTLTVCDTEIRNTALPPSLVFSFSGSDFALYGPTASNLAMNYTINRSPLRPATLNTIASSKLKTGVKLWSTSGMPGEMNPIWSRIEIFPSAGLFSFDYITYMPNKYTSLSRRNLILDDADSSIQYSPGWTRSNNVQFSNGIPYQATLSGSNIKGSTMIFNFIGASVSVNGALNQQSGLLSVSFSVDNAPATVFKPFNGTQATNTSSWRLYQQFFHQDLEAGNHTLLVTLKDVSDSQTLWIDSIVYKGSEKTDLGFPPIDGGGTTSCSSYTDCHPGEAVLGGIIAAIVVLCLLFCPMCRPYRRRFRKTIFTNGKELNEDLPEYSAFPPSQPSSRIARLFSPRRPHATDTPLAPITDTSPRSRPPSYTPYQRDIDTSSAPPTLPPLAHQRFSMRHTMASPQRFQNRIEEEAGPVDSPLPYTYYMP